jgi:ClpP class serine protease
MVALIWLERRLPLGKVYHQEELRVNFLDLFWVFLILASIQPLIRQRVLENVRTRTIRAMERRRKTRVIAMVHRQETMALLGFPLVRYIDIEDSEELLRAIQLTDPQLPIDLILHTPGGLVLAVEQIAHALTGRPSEVTVFVPHYAMSGGTMLALAADRIVMAPHAVLGPLDPQVGQFPAASILRAVEEKKARKMEIDDETLIMADVAAKAMEQVRKHTERILLRKKTDPERAQALAQALTEGRWTHDYPITVEEACELGLPVSADMPEEVYRLMRLFPQVAARRPGVQYVPLPYGAPPPGERRPKGSAPPNAR